MLCKRLRAAALNFQEVRDGFVRSKDRYGHIRKRERRDTAARKKNFKPAGLIEMEDTDTGGFMFHVPCSNIDERPEHR
jgi:hypothetical protein